MENLENPPSNSVPRGVAVVTGGSRGIGRSVVLELARNEFDVALCYSKAKTAAESVCAEVVSLGRKCIARPCRAERLDEVESFVEQVGNELGDIDLLVNNAGVIRDHPLALMDRSHWDEVIDVNLGGVFNFCRATVVGFMKRRTGRVINIASVSGIYGNPTQANYSASKAGIIGFSKALAKEVGRYGVLVNVVAPGFIETDMTEAVRDGRRHQILNQIVLGRFGDPTDVAHLVSFLASERSSYITGQVLQVDGGIVL